MPKILFYQVHHCHLNSHNNRHWLGRMPSFSIRPSIQNFSTSHTKTFLQTITFNSSIMSTTMSVICSQFIDGIKQWFSGKTSDQPFKFWSNLTTERNAARSFHMKFVHCSRRCSKKGQNRQNLQSLIHFSAQVSKCDGNIVRSKNPKTKVKGHKMLKSNAPVRSY